MTAVGQRERETQRRVVALFRDTLGYRYLGDWHDRAHNRNVEPDLVRAFLQGVQGYDDDLVTRALHELTRTAADTSAPLYDRNRAVYTLLRYGAQIATTPGAPKATVHFVRWDDPDANDFAVAEEVAVAAADPAAHDKRPDLVLYVNGIALGVLELKRSTVGVREGIRQNLDNQKKTFIEPFFSTMQLVMAGNDSEGLRYGTTQTPEQYYLTWKEEGPDAGLALATPLDTALVHLCRKARLLELVHDFVVFDRGVKKLCRPNQHFGVKAAERAVRAREGGIVWHTQGSGKSLTMVWLARWIREQVPGGRVLIVTDRTELDEQIEKVFLGVGEKLYRTRSGADLVARLGAEDPSLLCALVHKFGARTERDDADVPAYVAELRRALPEGFAPKGNLVVFVDECHRTQSGLLHDAMQAILPDALFIGFTGTPLLRDDRKRSIEVFGPYLHTYRFDQAVRDGVVLDLRYEARDVDTKLASPEKVDLWFESKTKGLTDLARAQLKQRWGTMRKVLSSKSRLAKIVADVMFDMETRERLATGSGNAMLVAGSIFEACKYYELFVDAGLGGKCAIVTSYRPNAADIKGEETGEGETERLERYETYRQMLAGWFGQPADEAVKRVDEFEIKVKERFVDEPGQMKLLIVVDKLLTGFDAPSATYLYIDKPMRDHGLFQAICRVNRLDDESKTYGYVVDYKDLFRSIEGAVRDYTSGALDGYAREDVEGLLKDRLTTARTDLDEALDTVRALCEPVDVPRDTQAYLRHFVSGTPGDATQIGANAPRRLALYKAVAALVRAFGALAPELADAGYDAEAARALRDEVQRYVGVRDEVKLASDDAVDLKRFEPAMRFLIDTYVQAEDSRRVSALDDAPLVRLLAERGAAAVEALPDGIRKDPEAVAETIENNVRRLLVDEHAVNPKYYDRMSELLDALIARRRSEALDYKSYLDEVAALARQALTPHAAGEYSAALDTPGRRALYDNVDRDEALALNLDTAVRRARQDGWRDHKLKAKQVRNAIRAVLAGIPSPADGAAARFAESPAPGPYGPGARSDDVEARADAVLALVRQHSEY